MRWLVLAGTAVAEEEEEGGEESSSHQTCTEQVQVQAGEHQWTQLSSATKSQ